jgi:hypothetical protein
MPIIAHNTIPEIRMRPGIRGKFLANKELGATGVSLLANTVEPGAAAPLHMHTVEETMLVLVVGFVNSLQVVTTYAYIENMV